MTRNFRDDHVSKKSSHRRYSVKKTFLEISQNSQENTCARVSLETLERILLDGNCFWIKSLRLQRYAIVDKYAFFPKYHIILRLHSKITLQHGCSPVNLLHILEHLFLRAPLEDCFWKFNSNSKVNPFLNIREKKW